MEEAEGKVQLRVDGQVVAEVQTWELTIGLETLSLSIGDVPVTVHCNRWGYDGVYNLEEAQITLDLPGADAEADKIVVLYVLLHEYAHHKHATLGQQNFSLLAKSYEEGGTHPIDVAANKHALRTMVKMGIPPSVIAERLKKAFANIDYANVGDSYACYRWAQKYFKKGG